MITTEQFRQARLQTPVFFKLDTQTHRLPADRFAMLMAAVDELGERTPVWAPIIVLWDPDHIRRVVVDNAENYSKVACRQRTAKTNIRYFAFDTGCPFVFPIR